MFHLCYSIEASQIYVVDHFSAAALEYVNMEQMQIDLLSSSTHGS